MSRATFRCYEPTQAHKLLTTVVWPEVKAQTMAGNRVIVEVRKETRSLAQNRRLWAMLADISSQVDWYGQKLTAENWKDVFSASLKRTKVVPGIEPGSFVVCGQSTSKMTIAEMSELQELMSAFGAEKGVRFTAQEFDE